MGFSWAFFVDIGLVSVALLVATYLRTRLRFLQKYLIPNAIAAGFLLLPLYNYAAPQLELSVDNLGELVYHLMSISFIAITLRASESTKVRGTRGISGTTVSVVFQYGAQGFLGLLLTWAIMNTIMPELFPSFGFFVPLGFALGPGQAFAIGRGWEVFGFIGAGSVGLTFAAIGFLLASFGGVFMVNYGYRKGWADRDTAKATERPDHRKGFYSRAHERPVGSRLTSVSEAIDTMSLNLGMIFATYLLSYLVLLGITSALITTGELGADLAVNLWGLNFVFAVITAMLVKRVLRAFGWHDALDSGMLTRIAGGSVDLMVASAVGAISLVVVLQYWLPILIISTTVGVFVLVSVPWMASRLFHTYRFHRAMIIFGGMTGTLPTGLALLRMVDPDFETPVASDYVFSSAVVFALVIPLILAINLPAYSVSRGEPGLFFAALALVAGYVFAAGIAYRILAGKRAFGTPLSIWYRSRPEID